MKVQMTDYHCHLIPAIDDGAVDLKESLEMARILSEIGFTTVHCTPHRIRGCYENDPPRVAAATGILQGHLDEEGIPLKLVPGCEHYLDEFLPGLLDDAPMIGEERAVLVEVPFRSGPELLRPMVSAFHLRGLTPLIAHPERCRAFEPAVKAQGLRGALSLMFGKVKATDLDHAEVTTLKAYGCLFQANLGSFAGYYGSEVRDRALLFLEHGIYSCVGSDSHQPHKLEETLQAGLSQIVSTLGEDAAFSLLEGFER